MNNRCLRPPQKTIAAPNTRFRSARCGGWEWVSQWAAVFLLLAAFVALTYFSVVFLVAVFALPRLIDLVARRDYPDLGRHGENVFWGSLGNTLGAGAIFVVAALALFVTNPLGA